MAETFGVTRQGTCQVLAEWLNITFELNAFETQLYETLCEEISEDGGYLVGSIWVFTTLHGKEYCASRKFDAANPSDLMKIISILKNLKPLILKH